MKKSKIFCIVICTLMIATVVPAIGIPIQPGDTKELNVIQPRFQPPTPGYAPIPPEDAILEEPILRERPEITAATMDDLVISMIQQVDEATFLSYEENLTANGPRPTESANCIASAEYIYEQFQDMGLDVRYHHWTSGSWTSDNVEATLNGTDESSDDIYIICAHYDTVASSPGADDDTSGTVAVLIAALIMSQYQFNHTIKFVAFSGEEQGMLGSGVYASQAASQGWDIVGVLNCDMISYAITSTDGNNLIVFEDTPSEWLYSYTVGINAEYDEYIGLTLHHGGPTWGSDHWYFWENGYSALFYFEYTETPYYHGPQDTIANINLTYAVKNTRLVLATLAELAEANVLSNPPARPTLTGPNIGVINELCTFNAVTTEPDGEDVSYYFDWGDGSNSGWLGPYTQGQQISAQKAWSAEGNYTVRVKAKDINQVSSAWSTPVIITILTDHPPNTPTLTGPAEGKPGRVYTYTLTTVDVDGDMVYYYIDWGDGQVSEWIGPYQSGASASVTHWWDEAGNYTIKAKAKDVNNLESDWATLEVTMPVSVEKHQAYQFNGFFQQLSELLQNLGLRLFRR